MIQPVRALRRTGCLRIEKTKRPWNLNKHPYASTTYTKRAA